MDRPKNSWGYLEYVGRRITLVQTCGGEKMTAEIFGLPLGWNDCHLIREEGTIMIDAGGKNKTPALKKALKDIEVEPNTIELIVITHGHPDHVTSAKDFKELTGAKIAMHQLDKQCLETGKWKETHSFKAAKGSIWGLALLENFKSVSE